MTIEEKFEKLEFETKFLNLIRMEVLREIENLWIVKSDFVSEFNRRGKTQIRTAEQAIKAASFVVGEVMLENLGFKKQGLGYAFSYLYKYKIRD